MTIWVKIKTSKVRSGKRLDRYTVVKLRGQLALYPKGTLSTEVAGHFVD